MSVTSQFPNLTNKKILAIDNATDEIGLINASQLESSKIIEKVNITGVNAFFTTGFPNLFNSNTLSKPYDRIYTINLSLKLGWTSNTPIVAANAKILNEFILQINGSAVTKTSIDHYLPQGALCPAISDGGDWQSISYTGILLANQTLGVYNSGTSVINNMPVGTQLFVEWGGDNNNFIILQQI